MPGKIKCILLIDDNAADNFFHERIIKRSGCAQKVVAKQTAMRSLEYLTSEALHEGAYPDLIFLDINMPGMNGWEFIEEYNKMNEDIRRNTIIYMLTTSSNPDDSDRAANIVSISGFLMKPLSEKMMEEITNKHFS